MINKFEDNVDPAFLGAQTQKAKQEQRKHRNAVNPILHNQPREERRGPGCGLFMVVALTWCLVACGPSRQFKDQSADVLDVARQLHWSGCVEEFVGDECNESSVIHTKKQPKILSGNESIDSQEVSCERDTMLPKDLCDKAYYTLVAAEPGIEDEIAKKRRIQALWEALEPVVWPYIQDGALTAAQLLLAYVTGNILGQALETVSKPP